MITQWHGCYNRKWENVIPDSAGFPANVAPSLALRIYFTAITRGYFTMGETILNPFAGVGSLAYHALAAGLNYVGIEESESNVLLLRRQLIRWNAQFVMLDRPGFSRVIAGGFEKMIDAAPAAGLVASLPYSPVKAEWPDYQAIAECAYAALRPGAYAVWIVRDWRRDTKKEQRYDHVVESWVKGNQYVGFELVDHAQAVLVEDHGDQLDIGGARHWRGRVYKSFFPRPDGGRSKVTVPHEDVLFFKKPE